TRLLCEKTDQDWIGTIVDLINEHEDARGIYLTDFIRSNIVHSEHSPQIAQVLQLWLQSVLVGPSARSTVTVSSAATATATATGERHSASWQLQDLHVAVFLEKDKWYENLPTNQQ